MDIDDIETNAARNFFERRRQRTPPSTRVSPSRLLSCTIRTDHFTVRLSLRLQTKVVGHPVPTRSPVLPMRHVRFRDRRTTRAVTLPQLSISSMANPIPMELSHSMHGS